MRSSEPLLNSPTRTRVSDAGAWAISSCRWSGSSALSVGGNDTVMVRAVSVSRERIQVIGGRFRGLHGQDRCRGYEAHS